MKINTLIIIGMIVFAVLACAEKMQQEVNQKYFYKEAQ